MFEGRFITIILATNEKTKTEDDPKGMMEIWDKIMTKFYYFTGDDLANSRRQWFVEDTQISLG